MATRMTRRESKAATRTELLDAGREVFVERGYHAASLELVAGAAGFTKGAVYSAFGSKGRLFLAVYEREIDRRWRAVEQDVERALRSGEPVAAGSRSARDFFARQRAERPWLLALLEFRLHAARDAELNAAYAALHHASVERLAAVLVRATGSTAEAALETAVAMLALGNGFVLEHLVLPDDATEERYVRASEAVVEALLPTPDGR